MVTEHCIPVDAGAVQLVVESRQLTNEILDDTYAGAVEAGDPASTTSAPRSTCAAPTTASSTCASTASSTSRTTTTSSTAAGANTVVRIDELAVGDPIEFSLACVEQHLPDMLRNCGVADLADEVEGRPDRVQAAVGRGPRPDGEGPSDA